MDVMGKTSDLLMCKFIDTNCRKLNFSAVCFSEYFFSNSLNLLATISHILSWRSLQYVFKKSYYFYIGIILHLVLFIISLMIIRRIIFGAIILYDALKKRIILLV